MLFNNNNKILYILQNLSFCNKIAIIVFQRIKLLFPLNVIYFSDAFVNDISAAITDQGVDQRLLPPNSVLKKMLDRSKLHVYGKYLILKFL